MVRRDYGPLILLAERTTVEGRASAMSRLCDLVWDCFGQAAGPRPSYSWIGFYEKTAGHDEMILAARRDKPACSPIGLHGICGRCWSERRPILVDDVSTLGASYIACDPKDRSEVVIPLFDVSGACWGVLDGDSHETAAFDLPDVIGLARLAEAFGLTPRVHDRSGSPGPDAVLRL